MPNSNAKPAIMNKLKRVLEIKHYIDEHSGFYHDESHRHWIDIVIAININEQMSAVCTENTMKRLARIWVQVSCIDFARSIQRLQKNSII